MNPLMLKLLPYAGWPLAALMFSFWLNARDAIIEEREGCNQDKLRAVAEAETITREALERANTDRIRRLEALTKAEKEARLVADLARANAEDDAVAAQTTIQRLRREAQNAETRTIEQECLLVDVPADLLDGLR